MAKFCEAITILVLFCYFKTSFGQAIVYEKQYIEPWETYTIDALSNPLSNPAGEDSKRWCFSTALDCELHLSCPVVNLPSIGHKCVNYLKVDHLKNGNNTYCKPFEVSGPNFTLELKCTSKEKGGTFKCTITSRPTSNKTLQDEKSPLVSYRSEDDCQCGYWFTGTPRIFGGEATRINEIPSMAYLRILNGQFDYCGATIISPRVALTAAHCVNYPKDPSSYKLIIGEHDTSKSHETNAEKHMVLRDIIIHKGYDPSSHGVNDVALLITEEKIKFTPKVGPACLPFNIDKKSIIGKEVIAAGWGYSPPSWKPSNILQKVQLQTESDSSCSYTIGSYYTPSQHICTITERGSITGGDSGGPLFYIDPETYRYTLVGVTSFKDKIEPGTWGVFMDVHHYLKWIQENLPSGTQLCGI